MSQLLSKVLGKAVGALPSWMFDVRSQMSLDAIAAAGALCAAILIRFEFDTSQVSEFAAWLLVLAILRPLMLSLLHTYRSTWRHFHLADALVLSLHSFAVTLLLAGFRVF